MEAFFFIFLGFIILLLVVGYNKVNKWNATMSKAILDRKLALSKLTLQANAEIKKLKNEYDTKKDGDTKGFFKSSSIDNEYSKRYKKIEKKYREDRQLYLTEWMKNNPQWAKSRKTWGKIFIFGLIANFIGCSQAAMSSDEDKETPTASTAMSSNDITYWNAKTIPMPHLQDSLQYVSNPDHVLSQVTVDSMNIYLQKLDHDLNIESAVIIVNHIENDDPFRMAQDVGNSYGVGRNDRGLVVVVGYQDHSVNISPGRALEADLTDAECGRLQREYVIPSMRAEKPDSAMLYLTKGIYATMLKKELPVMSPLYENENEDFPTSFLFYNLFFIGWGIFFTRKNRQYQWISNNGAPHLTPNPFVSYDYSSGNYSSGGGYSSGSGYSSSSSSGGGSYGGGNFGGGGATSRW